MWAIITYYYVNCGRWYQNSKLNYGTYDPMGNQLISCISNYVVEVHGVHVHGNVYNSINPMLKAFLNFYVDIVQIICIDEP